jgi:hypothetical protein
MEKISVIKIELHDLPNIIVSPEQWINEGGYRGLMKSFCIRPGTIKKVVRTKMNAIEFDALPAWEG